MSTQTGSVYEYITGLEKDLSPEEAKKEASRQLGIDVDSLSVEDLTGDVSQWFGPMQTLGLPPAWQAEFDEAEANQRSIGRLTTPLEATPDVQLPTLYSAVQALTDPNTGAEAFRDPSLDGALANYYRPDPPVGHAIQQQTPRHYAHEAHQLLAENKRIASEAMEQQLQIQDATDDLMRKWESNTTVWEDVGKVIALGPVFGTDNPISRGVARAAGTAGRIGAEAIDYVLGTELVDSEEEAKTLAAYYQSMKDENAKVIKERIDRRAFPVADELLNIVSDMKDLVEGVAGIAGFYFGITESDLGGFSENVEAGWDMGGQLMSAIAADVTDLGGTKSGNWFDTVRSKPVSTFLTVVPIARALTAMKGLSKIRGVNGAGLKAKARAFLNKWEAKYDEIIGKARPPVFNPQTAPTPPMPKELMTAPQRVLEGIKSAGKKASDIEKLASTYMNPVTAAIDAGRRIKGKMPGVRESLAEHSEADVQSALYDYERTATNIGDQARTSLEREVLKTGEEPSNIGLDIDLESGVSLRRGGDSQEVAPPDPSEGMTPGATLTMPPTIRRIAEAEQARGRKGTSPAERYWDIARQEALSGERKTYGVMLKTYDFTLDELNALARNPEKLRAAAIRKGIDVSDEISPQQILADLSQVGTEEKRIAINPSQEAPAGLKWVDRDTDSPSLAPIDDSASARELWRPGDPLRGYVASGKMQSDIASSPSGSRFQLVNEAGRLDYGIVVELWKDLWEGHGRMPRPNRNELSTKQIVELTEFINDQTGLDTRGAAKTNIPYDRPTMARSAEAQRKLVEGEQRGEPSREPSEGDVSISDLVSGASDSFNADFWRDVSNIRQAKMAEEGAPGMKRLEARIRDLEKEIAAESSGARSPEMSDPTLRGYKAKVETGLDDAGNPVYTEITGTMEQLRRQMREIEESRRAKDESPSEPLKMGWEDAPPDSPLWADVRSFISEKRKEFPTGERMPSLKNMSTKALADEAKSYIGKEDLGLFPKDEWKKISRDMRRRRKKKVKVDGRMVPVVQDRRVSARESAPAPEKPLPKKSKDPVIKQETLEFEEGTYTGSTADGLPSGKGTYKEPGGYSETGIFEDGMLKEGTLRSEDGSTFRGELKDGVIPYNGILEGTRYGEVTYIDGVAYDANGKLLPPETQSSITAPKGATPAGKEPPASPPRNPWDKIADQSKRLADKRKEDARLKNEALEKKLNISSKRAQRYRQEIFKISADVQRLARQKAFFNGLRKSEKFFQEIEDGKVPESLPLGFGDKDLARAISTLESLPKPSRAQKSLLKRLKNAEYQGEPKRTSKKRKKLEKEDGYTPEEATAELEGLSVQDGWGWTPFGYLQKTKPAAKAEFKELMTGIDGEMSPIARYLEDTGQRLMVPKGVNDSLAFMNIVREARNQTDAISQMKATMKRGLVSRRLRGIANATMGNWLTEALTDGNLAAPIFAVKDAASFAKWRKDPSSVPKVQSDFFEFSEANGLTHGDFVSGEIGRSLSEIGDEATNIDWWDKVRNSKPVKALDTVNAQQERIWKFVDHSYKIRRAWNSYRKSRSDFLEMAPGRPAIVTASKIKKYKVEKLPDGTWSVDGKNVGGGKDGAMPKRVKRILADAAAYDANSKYFDYRFKSRYQAFLSTNALTSFAAPFYSWLFYAMSAPGKRGLAGAMRQTESMIKHTDPKIAFRQNVRGLKASVRLFAATQQVLQDTEDLSDEARRAINYGNQAPTILTKGDDDHWFVKSLKNMNPLQPFMDQSGTAAAGILELGTATGVLDDVEDFEYGNFSSREEANAELKKLINRAKIMTTTPTLKNFADFAGLGGGFGINNFRKILWGDPQFSDYMGMVLPAILGGTSADVIDATIGLADSGSPLSKRSKNPASAEAQAWDDFAAETVLSMGAKAIGKAGKNALKRYVNKFDSEWRSRYTKSLSSDLKNAEALRDGKRAKKIRSQIRKSNRLRDLAKKALIRELEGRN